MQQKHIWGLCGLLIGAIGGYIGAGVYFYKKNEEFIDKKAQEKCEQYIAELEDNKDPGETTAEEPIYTTSEASSEIDYSSFYRKPSPKELVRMSKQAMAEAEHPQDSGEDTEFESQEEKDERYDAELHGDKIIHKEPFLIQEDDFAEMNHYDKEVLYWYDNDDILATEGDEIIEDVMSTVGTFIDMFDDPGLDGIFVRNARLSTDYNIIRLNESFMEHISGDPDWAD